MRSEFFWAATVLWIGAAAAWIGVGVVSIDAAKSGKKDLTAKEAWLLASFILVPFALGAIRIYWGEK